MLLKSLSEYATDSCHNYYPVIQFSDAKERCLQGSYFKFKSTRNQDKLLNVFYHCSDDPENKDIVLGYGWPKYSFDF